MTTTEIADRLDGKDHVFIEFNDNVLESARANKIIIIYGMSDGVIRVCGLFDEYFDAWEDTVFIINKFGICEESMLDRNEPEAYDQIISRSLKIYATPVDTNNGIAWSFATDIPHEEFTLYNHSKPNSNGIVIHLSDL